MLYYIGNTQHRKASPMLNDILRSVGPMIAAAMAGKFESGEFRFDNGKFHFDGEWEGQRLEDLDLTQPAPEKVMVLGSTAVTIVEGKTFRIQAQGDGADALRFALRDGKLAVLRKGGNDRASVEITMPAPRALGVAGSGSIEADALAANAKLNIAGSGAIALDSISCERLKANIMGSGRLHVGGSVDHLKLSVAGSGIAEMAALEVAQAKISVAGSGVVRLASDGAIEANLMGSGHVTVYGRANCKVHSMGAGKLHCVPRDSDRGSTPDAPTPPEPPKPPKPPKSGAAAAKPDKPRKRTKAKPAKAPKGGKMTKTARKTSKPRKKAAKKAE